MDCEGDIIKSAGSFSINEDNKQSASMSDSHTELFLYRSNINSLLSLQRTHAELLTLTIIGQPELHSLSGIENIPCLQELWVAECSIQDTSPITKCTQLVKLYLYSNMITRIPDLSASKETIQILWLSGNKISSIEHMYKLKELKELNLGNNNIYEIGSTLQNNKNLQTLNLSGNPIYKFKDLCHLSILDSLKCLKFADLLYGECPVAQMCNYRPYTVYHLPNLEELDAFTISNGERQLVKDFYSSKKVFYTNSHQQLLNSYYRELEKKDKENREVVAQFRESLFIYNLKEIEVSSNIVHLVQLRVRRKLVSLRRQKPLSSEAAAVYNVAYKRKKKPELKKETCNEHIRTKLAHLPLKMKKWEKVLLEWKVIHEDDTKVKEYQLNYELKTAGNIIFTEVAEEKNELKTACQILLSHFLCPHTRRKYGIREVELQRVIQIRNKGLELLWQSLELNKHQHMSPTFMLLHDPITVNRKVTWPFKLCEKGFIGMKEYTLQITDCLCFNDLTWLKQINEKRSLLSVFSQEYSKERHVCLIIKLPSLLRLRRIQKENPKLDKTASESNLQASEDRTCNIFQVSDPKAVVPLCILEYQYIIENPLETFKRRMGWTCDIHAAQLSPVSLPIYPVLNETSISRILPEDTNFDAITELTLTGCGIRSIGVLTKLPNVMTLNMSCNNFTSISDFSSFPNLKYLDISFNSIYSLNNSEDLPHLETMNISWNQIIKLLECILCLKNHVPALLNLDISHNPLDVTEKEHIHYLIHQQLPNLDILNEVKIAKSLSKNITVDLKDQDLLTKGSFIPQTLDAETTQLKWKAEICHEIYNEEPMSEKEATEDDNSLKWISLSGKYIVDVKHPNMLEKTLWADFSHNLLSNVNFLVNGEMLQELSLKHNVIQKLGPWLHNLKNLVKLDLSYNYITSLEAFCGSNYPSLKVLNVSKNWLRTLNGIENCEALEEFYASHNCLTHLDDLHGVQNCKMLKIIDLSDNPLQCGRELYRFITFHLSNIEVMNCSCIHVSESTDTSELFDGCLKEEYFLRYHTLGDHKSMTELTLSNCQIKKINIQGDLLPNLSSLDLQNNKISSLWCFRNFPSLTTLRLSYNHVTQMKQASDLDDEKKCKIFFPNLTTLFLDNNGIINTSALHLGTLKKLETLFLHDNELMTFSNLQDLKTLVYLVLDRNKLECAYSEDFSQLTQLKELYLEGNKIQLLNFFRQMRSLERVFIGKNEISDPEELRHLRSLRKLHEMGILGNPMCHKVNYYLAINQYLPNVTLMDGAATDQLHELNQQ